MSAIPQSYKDTDPSAQAAAELALATSLYQVLACGHGRLAFNIAGTFPLWRRGARGRWEPVREVGLVPEGEWRPCLEVRPDGTTVPRRFNPFLLAGHIRGQYDIAPNAPSWSGGFTLDLDTPIDHELRVDDSNEVIPSGALGRALADRDARLAAVWRALGLGPGRLPVILQSPGLGLHVSFPLMRAPGACGAGGEHTWPAGEIVDRVATLLHQHGIALAGGRVELYPAGRPLRAPCGRGTVLLDAADPEHSDRLGLHPVPGTTSTRHLVREGERYPRMVRRPWVMVPAFLARWEAARRPLDEWLGDRRPWCPVWGPFAHPDRAEAEKNRDLGVSGRDCFTQHIDEVRGGAVVPAGAPRVGQGGHDPGASSRSDPQISKVPSAASSAQAARSEGASVASPLRRGSAFREHLVKLLRYGVTQASTRHDAVLTLVFWWHVVGKTEIEVRAELEAWARAYPHASRLKGERLVRTCLREGMHYYHRIKKLPQRARALARTVTRMRALAPADFVVLAQVRADVRDEAHAILEYLAGHAEADGRVARPVTLGRAQLDALVTRDHRIIERGQRRRAEVIAVEELERLGVLTLFVDYSTENHGRIWSCWYQFGSGVRARPREAGVYERSQARRKAPADALVVAERPLREGTLRVLSAGTRGRPFVEMEPGPGVVVEDTGGRRWWVAMFEGRHFTVGEFFAADEAVMIAGPWKWAPFRSAEPAAPAAARDAGLPSSGNEPAAPVATATRDEGGGLAVESVVPTNPAPNGRAALAAELEVDVEQLGDMDPELAALAARAIQTVTRRGG
jgi:hypothetical protein